MRSATAPLLGILVTCALHAMGCSKTVYHHASATAASGDPTSLGFGLGRTTSETRRMFMSSSFDDTRVEHAAGTSPDGARDRFWRVYVEENSGDPFAVISQKLQLCEGEPQAPRGCVFATHVDSNEVVVGLPTLLESTNLGASQRFTSASASSTTWLTAQGEVLTPLGRASTPALGVWIVSAPETANTLYGRGSSTGALMFCHAPEDGAPRCNSAPVSPAIAQILSVQLVQTTAGLRHVVWYQGRTEGSRSTLTRPSSTVVRCQADDLTALIECQSTEVSP